MIVTVFIHLINELFIHSFIHLFDQLFIYSFIHSLCYIIIAATVWLSVQIKTYFINQIK